MEQRYGDPHGLHSHLHRHASGIEHSHTHLHRDDDILNAQAFHYTSCADTEIGKTFARVRRSRAKAEALMAATRNVRPLARRNA